MISSSEPNMRKAKALTVFRPNGAATGEPFMTTWLNRLMSLMAVMVPMISGI